MALRLPRLDVLILSTLQRRAMNGYELKLELRYRHVRWWAKCEHGHVYAALTRLERDGLIERVSEGKRGSRVYGVSARGRDQLAETLREFGTDVEPSYFDVDLFLAASYVLPRERAVQVLRERADLLYAQVDEARGLLDRMRGKVPTSGLLIMGHRIDHLESERLFALHAADTLEQDSARGPFMGEEPIGAFLERTGVEIERA